MKRLYSIVACAMMGALGVTASAQTEYKILEDLTAKKLVNADFAADEPITTLVRTYAKDMLDEGLGAGGEEMYGQQPVTGWTAVFPTDNIKNETSAVGGDARAAGIYTYIDFDTVEPAGLGGSYTAPDEDNCESMTGGKALGLVAVWGAAVQYTQDVTLPAGSYMIVVPVANTAGTGAIDKSLNGFITAGGVEYVVKKSSYEVGLQHNDTVVFKLTEETAGVVSVGYKASGIGSTASPHLFIDCVKLYSIDPAALDAQEVAAAKEQLLVVIEEGEQLGVDVTAAMAVYDNDGATLEDVMAAIAAQKEANKAGQTDLSEFFITNPHFNLDNVIEDGICTYDYDMKKNEVTHYGMQPLSGWVASDPAVQHTAEEIDSEQWKSVNNARACGVFAIGGEAFLGGKGYLPPQVMSDGSSEGKVLGFISVWSATTQYKQVVSIPAGKYTLTISYYNAGGTGTIAKNLMGFITDDGEEYLSDVKVFKEKSWEKMQILFELEETTSGYFTLGFQAADAGSGSMPHFFIDGITLNYVGDVNFDPSLFALKAVVASATNLLEETMQASLLEKLGDAIDEGRALVTSQSDNKEANLAAIDLINGLVTQAHESIAAYERLQGLIDVLEEESADDELGAIGNMAELISDMLDDMQDAYEEGTMSVEEIDAAVARHGLMIIDEVKRVLASEDGPGTNITPLLKNPGFDNGYEGWSGTAPTVRAGVAEFYNKTFDMYQVIEGLPNGKYEVKVSGFHRFGSTDATLDAHNDGTEEDNIAAYIYGNEYLTKFKSIFAGASNDDVKTVVDENGDEKQYVYYKDDKETSLGFVPYSMEGFAAAEAVTDAYETSAVALVTDGTLRVGVRVANNPSGEAWTIFDSFRVTYVGNQPADYAESIEKAAAGLVTACEEYIDAAVNLPAETQLNVEAIAAQAIELAGNAATVDECIAILDKISAARKHLDEVVGQVKEYEELVAYYDVAIYAYEGVDFDFESYYSKLNEEWETEAELAGYIAAIDADWSKGVQAGNAQATAAEPYDVTAMLRNPGFTWNEEETKKYWTITNDYGDASYSLIEFYGKPSWEISQQVAGLAAGYYKLSVQGAYRCSQQLTDVVAARMEGTEPHDVYVFANNGTTEWKTAIMSILDSKEDLTQVVVEGANRNATLETELATRHNTYEAGVTLISPTGHEYTREYFDYDPQGQYEDPANMGYWKDNTVVFEVKEGDVITLGCKKEEVNTDGGNWTPLDNFQLFYLGTQVPDAIENVQATGSAVVRQDYYTIDGMRVARPVKGVNLIVTTCADGSKSTVKAVVK